MDRKACVQGPPEFGGAAKGRVFALAMGVAVCISASQAVQAGEFTLGDGIDGRASLDVSLSGAMRTQSPDARLISKGNGGSAESSFNNDGEKNYKKGSVYSALGKALGELELKKDDLGLFVRGKAWYDYAESTNNVPFGNNANGFQPHARLNDNDFEPLSKFSGYALQDAYVYDSFELDPSRSVKVKLGNQVVNWGESLFIPGINQSNPIDASAFHRPGTEVKEVLLPVPQASANLGLGNGLSLEGYYQFKWERSVLDGCGTYWSPSDLINCSNKSAVFPTAGVSDPTAYKGVAALGGLNEQMSNAGEHKGKDGGQFGVSPHYFMSSIGTDFGAYYSQYNSRMPIYSLVRSRSSAGSLYSVRPSQYFEDYSASGIKVYGLSASTELGGWSVAGEVSRSNDIPVQINPNDMTNGLAAGIGPMASLATLPMGTVIKGYDLKSKNQIQVSTIKSFPNVMGADSLELVGEVAYQHWNGIGDASTSTRYGRATVYGLAASATSACGTSVSADCGTDGFATSDAWGYRAQLSWHYDNVFTGINLTPRIFWSQDVRGTSADNTFMQDRWTLGVGVHADLNKSYYADLSYSTYNHSAHYDYMRDRDFVSLVTGVKF